MWGVEKKGQREKEEGGGSFGRREREVSGITPGSNCVPGAVELFFFRRTTTFKHCDFKTICIKSPQVLYS